MSAGKGLRKAAVRPARCARGENDSRPSPSCLQGNRAAEGGDGERTPRRGCGGGRASPRVEVARPALQGRGPRWPWGQLASRTARGTGPPAPLVPARGEPRPPGYLSVGPMQAVSVLSISRRIRSCSAAVSRLSASAILPRSIDWGARQPVPSFGGSAHLTLPLPPRVPEPPQPPAARRTTPPSAPARPLASARPLAFCATASGIRSSLGGVREDSARVFKSTKCGISTKCGKPHFTPGTSNDCLCYSNLVKQWT